MKKRPIKVVKHDAVVTKPSKAEAARLRAKKPDPNPENEMIRSVKGWISERAANSKTAGMISESDRLAWEGGAKKKKGR